MISLHREQTKRGLSFLGLAALIVAMAAFSGGQGRREMATIANAAPCRFKVESASIVGVNTACGLAAIQQPRRQSDAIDVANFVDALKRAGTN